MYVAPKVKPLCPPEKAPRFEDVPYAEVVLDNGESYTLKMDIYQNPNQTEPGPCIVYIFGGGWSWGEYKQVTQKAVYCRDLVRLTEEGYTVVCPDYRLIHQSIFPACIHDVKGCIRFLKANAEKYHIDADRIGALGNSAGGHLAAMLSVGENQPEIEGNVGGNLEYDSTIKAASIFYAPVDLCEAVVAEAATVEDQAKNLTGTEVDNQSKGKADSIMALAVGYVGPGRNIKTLGDLIEKQDVTNPDWKYAELLRKCSPITYVSEDCVPVCLFHGGHDPLVSPKQTEDLYHALLKAGADVTMICSSYGGHGPSLGEKVDQFAYQFLKDRL
jgi:Esterase/lipase